MALIVVAITAIPNRYDRRAWRNAVIRIGRETRSVSETWNVIPMVNATYAKSPIVRGSIVVEVDPSVGRVVEVRVSQGEREVDQ